MSWIGHKYLIVIFSIIVIICPVTLFAAVPELSIACSSNFYGTLNQLIESYNSSGHKIKFTVTQGSSSKLSSQIMNGLPIDIFLSADDKYTKHLVTKGMANKPFAYAIGEVVLFANNYKRYSSARDYLDKADISHLSLANPSLAPYGAKAKKILISLGLWHKLSPKIVYGEDIGLAFNYVVTDNASAGFVALSQVIQYQNSNGQDHSNQIYYFNKPLAEIKQQGIIVKRSKHIRRAKEFVKYLLLAPQTRNILQENGYELPANQTFYDVGI